MRFFEYCVGIVDYAFVKDELNAMKISYPILEKVLSLMTVKLREMRMTDAYIERFTNAFQDNMAKVIPKTIIQKIGNLENLKKIVMRTIETLFLEHCIIDSFTPSTAEHIVSCAHLFIRDESKQQIQQFFEEFKFQHWFSKETIYMIKQTGLQMMLKHGVDTLVAYRIVEQFENYRCFLFEQVVPEWELDVRRGNGGSGNQQGDYQGDGGSLIESIMDRFHENSEISGFFLDPSEENSRYFISMVLNTLYGTNYFKVFVRYLQNHLKIPANRRFFENLKELLRKTIPALSASSDDHQAIAELDYKMFVLQCKLGVFSSNVFAKFLKNIDEEIVKIRQRVIEELKMVHLPRAVTDDDVIQCVTLLKDILVLAFQTDFELYNVADLVSAATFFKVNVHALPILGFILKTYFETKNEISNTDLEIILECIQIIFSA